jgi:hypothetical protein
MISKLKSPRKRGVFSILHPEMQRIFKYLRTVAGHVPQPGTKVHLSRIGKGRCAAIQPKAMAAFLPEARILAVAIRDVAVRRPPVPSDS